MIDIEKLAKKVEAHDDYRVLRRLKHIPNRPNSFDPEKLRKGIYLDVETTGLKDDDEITELCMHPFDFDTDGRVLDLYTPLHSYNEPRHKEITPAITEITGITLEMVKGHRLPVEEIETLLDRTQLVVAHNAVFDRPHMERVSKKFEGVCWGCSMEQIPWKVRSRKLENILASMGLFYDAHNAASDCYAGIRALVEPIDDKSALSHLLEASRKKTWHVWAINAPFNNRQGKPHGDESFKPREYYWNPGINGQPKAWHKEVEDMEAEEKWLRETVYVGQMLIPARFDEVNAFNRFSRRG